jgi:hypothetical protein
MSGLLSIINMLNPRPAVAPPADYSGLEYKWKMFSFRPAYFKVEALAFLALGAFLLLYLGGQYLSNSRAQST